MEKYEQGFTMINNEWFRSHEFFRKSALLDRMVMLYMVSNIIRKPSERFENFGLLMELNRRGLLCVNTSKKRMSEILGVSREGIYKSVKRLKEKGALIEKETYGTNNNIFIVGVNNGIELLFIDSDRMKEEGSLKHKTVKYLHTHFEHSDFLTKKNSEGDNLIDSLWFRFFNKNKGSNEVIISSKCMS